MAELLLENTKRLEEMPSRTKRLAYPLYSSVCAIAMMSGLVFADIIANELFLVVVLCLSIILRLSRYLLRQYSHFGFILILAFYAGGFASFIEQYRYDRPLITEVNDLEITGKIDKLEQQTEERWSNTQFVIHNYRYTKQISCKSRAVHLLSTKPTLDHCKDTPIYFVVDNSAHKYLIFRRGDEFFFQPQKRAPLHKAWRP